MSFLSDIHAYWQGNATLTAALPATSVYTGLVPEGLALPYGVIVPISSVPSFTTGASYFEAFRFQISIFHSDPDLAESIAATVMAEFDYAAVSASTISCERENTIFTADPDTARKVYHVAIEYVLYENRSLA